MFACHSGTHILTFLQKAVGILFHKLRWVGDDLI